MNSSIISCRILYIKHSISSHGALNQVLSSTPISPINVFHSLSFAVGSCLSLVIAYFSSEILLIIADLAGENKIYLHVDGAYGAAFNLSKRKELFKGMERGNSLTFDPHKYLYTPYQNGVILFRDQAEHSLIERFNADGDAYMFKPEKNDGGTFKERTMRNHGKRRLSGSSGGQAAASLWSVINTLGKDGIRLVLDHTIDVTDYAYRQLFGSSVFNTLCEPDLNTLCIYPKDKMILKDMNLEKKLLEETSKRMDKKGIYISTTTLPANNETRDLTVFRLVITNPYTDKKEVDMAIEGLHVIWEEIISEYKKGLIF